MKSYLWHNEVLLKEFGKHAGRTSNQLKAVSEGKVERLGRPVKYLKPSEDKEAVARRDCRRTVGRQRTLAKIRKASVIVCRWRVAAPA
jgi:hypothetical protein